MLITLSRRTAICQSVAEVQLTSVVTLGAVSHRFIYFYVVYCSIYVIQVPYQLGHILILWYLHLDVRGKNSCNDLYRTLVCLYRYFILYFFIKESASNVCKFIFKTCIICRLFQTSVVSQSSLRLALLIARLPHPLQQTHISLKCFYVVCSHHEILFIFYPPM